MAGISVLMAGTSHQNKEVRVGVGACSGASIFSTNMWKELLNQNCVTL